MFIVNLCSLKLNKNVKYLEKNKFLAFPAACFFSKLRTDRMNITPNTERLVLHEN